MRAFALLLALGATCSLASASRGTAWQPAIADAVNYASHRHGTQRWGIAQVQPSGWRLYFKGGWGSGTGWVDHQVALLTRGDQRVSVAILTYHDGTHAYGLATLRGIAARLLRGLGAAEPVR